MAAWLFLAKVANSKSCYRTKSESASAVGKSWFLAIGRSVRVKIHDDCVKFDTSMAMSHLVEFEA